MLVLTRKAGEMIQIGDNITIRVAEINGSRVKIGIDAPHSMRILRAELGFWGDAAAKEPPAAETAAIEPVVVEVALG
jgi:carbon storage regulator